MAGAHRVIKGRSSIGARELLLGWHVEHVEEALEAHSSTVQADRAVVAGHFEVTDAGDR